MPPKLLEETLVPISRAYLTLPGKPTPRQLHHWRLTGLVVPGRTRPLRLECIKIGMEWHTTYEAYERFIAALNE